MFELSALCMGGGHVSLTPTPLGCQGGLLVQLIPSPPQIFWPDKSLLTLFLSIFDEEECCPVFDRSSWIQVLSLHGYGTTCLLTQLTKLDQWRAAGRQGESNINMYMYRRVYTNLL